ncbi:hypothetical protein [Sediminicoccus sp. KRV36]|uniref:hypothetical protein n=1 Tax=Sediminicoccus sp. KRV36 TaxID=3133721 RepID=UPI00200D1EBA|nr:hypothetical protein [Sediminicoccus rosea]UPY38649.1 hypothetical protein LHU95_08120 [Sediminicoccus rosea]
MTLPEIREADAPPEVAAIYGKLREAYGLPLVNLIWRHFATLPGVLPWAWASVAPALPLVPAATARLVAALEPLPSLPLGAGAAELAALYNRGNLSNLIVLTALLRGKQGHAEAPAGPPPAMLPAPPPLPRLDALSPKVLREVLALAGLHGHAGGVIPTLYLHLAHWPEVLAPLYAALSPMMAMGGIQSLRDRALGAASLEATALQPYLAQPPEPPAEALAAAREALAQFTGRVIAEMVPIGLMLRR